jgi:hypothetical protein
MSELLITGINIIISMVFFFGVYKNKIDTLNKMVDRFNELEIKIARLEEKINFLIEKKISNA